MKNQNSTANTNFWKTLAIMFGIFILIAASILFIANSFAEGNDIAGKQIIVKDLMRLPCLRLNVGTVLLVDG